MNSVTFTEPAAKVLNRTSDAERRAVLDALSDLEESDAPRDRVDPVPDRDIYQLPANDSSVLVDLDESTGDVTVLGLRRAVDTEVRQAAERDVRDTVFDS